MVDRLSVSRKQSILMCFDGILLLFPFITFLQHCLFFPKLLKRHCCSISAFVWVHKDIFTIYLGHLSPAVLVLDIKNETYAIKKKDR